MYLYIYLYRYIFQISLHVWMTIPHSSHGSTSPWHPETAPEERKERLKPRERVKDGLLGAGIFSFFKKKY